MSLPCNEVLRDAHDDTPKADIRGKQRHGHVPKRSLPLGFEPMRWVRKSPATVVVGLLRLERTTGRPRIRFADPHRLRPPVGDLASSLQTLRVCLTLAPSRVRAHAMGTKKPGYRGSQAVALGADNGARTRDPNLGKVVLYQLSHVRICKTKRAPERPDVAWRRSPDSNRG